MYLDSGFGGMLLQIVVALVATGGAALFALRKKIKAFFNKNKSGNSPAATQPQGDETDDVIDTIDDNN